MSYEWTERDADEALSNIGRIVNIGQISQKLARGLDKRVRAGDLTKRRGYWNEHNGFGCGPLKTIWELVPIPQGRDIHSRTDALNLRTITYTNRATPACQDAEGRSYWIPRDAVAKDGSAGIFFRISDADRRDVSGATYDFDGWEPWADVKHCGTLFGGRHQNYESALAWLEQHRPESVA
jgi:hypothetical protein